MKQTSWETLSKLVTRPTLPSPPIVAQNGAVLPDGVRDPQSVNDCGEACVSSVVQALRGFLVSPGCWREGLGGPDRTGITSPDDLCRLLRVAGLPCQVEHVPSDGAWELCHRLRHFGSYRIVLGYWLSHQELHWMVAYESDSKVVWAMDPWTSRRRMIEPDEFALLFGGSMVHVWL